jgi:D-arabinose 1-dehydrogenase-like Zn-dependent alcohol dehydrogenase
MYLRMGGRLVCVGMPANAAITAPIVLLIAKVRLDSFFRVSISSGRPRTHDGVLFRRTEIAYHRIVFGVGSSSLCAEREFTTVTLLIQLSSTRQDMREALQLAARGKVKCRYVERRWDELNECVPYLPLSFYASDMS